MLVSACFFLSLPMSLELRTWNTSGAERKKHRHKAKEPPNYKDHPISGKQAWRLRRNGRPKDPVQLPSPALPPESHSYRTGLMGQKWVMHVTMGTLRHILIDMRLNTVLTGISEQPKTQGEPTLPSVSKHYSTRSSCGLYGPLQFQKAWWVPWGGQSLAEKTCFPLFSQKPRMT